MYVLSRYRVHTLYYMYIYTYSETSLIRTSLGPFHVSTYGGIPISGVSFSMQLQHLGQQ